MERLGIMNVARVTADDRVEVPLSAHAPKPQCNGIERVDYTGSRPVVPMPLSSRKSDLGGDPQGRLSGMHKHDREPRPSSGAGVAAAALAASGLAFPSGAHASFLPPEMMDAAAMYLAWFVIIFVPIGGIVLFWLVHILPEKIAHKRHHPQRDAIQVLCLLSLVFGGLLWPIAWLWAYTKPAGYRMAYGTEKHDDYFHEMGAKAQAGELLDHELTHLRDELDAMAAKGSLSAELKALRKSIATAQAAPAGSIAEQAASAGAGAKAGAA